MPVKPSRKAAWITGPPARRGAAAAAALALAAGAAGCKDLTAGPAQVKEQDQTYQHSVSRIEFAVQSGKVRLSPGSDGTVVVHRTLKYDQAAPTVSETWSGSTLRVSATCPDSGECSVDFTVKVPASVEVQMNDGTGDISLQDLTGSVDVTLGTGNVDLAALTGRVRVDSRTGTIDGTALQSTDVQLTGNTGDVSADFAKAPDTVRAVTTTGRVHVAVPQDAAGYRVQADATTGKVTVSVPQETSSRYSIVAKATTGDVSVD
jgi:Putative adhesin